MTEQPTEHQRFLEVCKGVVDATAAIIAYCGSDYDTRTDTHKAALSRFHHKFTHDVLALRHNVQLSEKLGQAVDYQQALACVASIFNRMDGDFMTLVKTELVIDAFTEKENALLDAIREAAQKVYDAVPEEERIKARINPYEGKGRDDR